jgi:hypothetical protein
MSKIQYPDERLARSTDGLFPPILLPGKLNALQRST